MKRKPFRQRRPFRRLGFRGLLQLHATGLWPLRTPLDDLSSRIEPAEIQFLNDDVKRRFAERAIEWKTGIAP